MSGFLYFFSFWSIIWHYIKFLVELCRGGLIAVECLPSMCKALSSISSSIKRKRKFLLNILSTLGIYHLVDTFWLL
jgi:hypothetical protein